MKWNPGQAVRHIDDVAKNGTVTDQTRSRSSGEQCRVRWDGGRLEWHYEDELIEVSAESTDPLDLIKEGCYARVDDLRRKITHIYLSGRLSNTLYSMGLTNTDFFPHQYKPLLTLLDSPANGLLIADEVGLGKTIEAGLIWTELRARYDCRRLLIVCPAMLVEKWRHELALRFGVNAKIVNADELFHELRRESVQEQAWIISYQGSRLPKGWSVNDIGVYKESARARLADLLYEHSEQNSLVDMVIFDEAHYMRNDATGAWRMAELWRDASSYQIMLSATPINLHSEDLYNLLRLLDPDNFHDKQGFDQIRSANKFILSAISSLKSRVTSFEEKISSIKSIKNSHWLNANNRKIDRLIDDAKSVKEWSPSTVMQFVARLEKINYLSHIITRTLKRDVQTNRVQRKIKIADVPMDEREHEFYQAITAGVHKYAVDREIEHGFLLSMPQRMVSSSSAALLRAWSKKETDEDAAILLEDDFEMTEDGGAFEDLGLKNFLIYRIVNNFSYEEMRKVDSKYKRLIKELEHHFKVNREDKVVIFTSFRSTAKYLSERLCEDGLNADLLMGGGSFNKDALVEGFRENSKAQVLVCTDVAAEGVDLQFCRVLFNYDWPWNPMRIEQRIGRIDRIGQKAQQISIIHFSHQNTVDGKIMHRLHQRFKVFEESLGESEKILGEITRLEKKLIFSPNLTSEDEQRLFDQALLVIEANQRRQNELEEEAVHLVAHGQHLLNRIQAAGQDGVVIGKDELKIFILGYLLSVDGVRILPVGDSEDEYEIGLSPALASEFTSYLKREGQIGKTWLASGEKRNCHFVDKVTEKGIRGKELIHRFHPIVRFICEKIKNNDEDVKVYASKIISKDIPCGDYLIFAKMASFSGVKEEDHLMLHGIDMKQRVVLDRDFVQGIFDAVRKEGGDWPSAAQELPRLSSVVEAERCELISRDDYRALLTLKKEENEDRVNVQLNILRNHKDKKRERFEELIRNHEHRENLLQRKAGGLAKAEQKKLEIFLDRMRKKEEDLRLSIENFSAETKDICYLFVRVE